ncbi:unnamed protein product, partial [Lepidochelys kempii]
MKTANMPELIVGFKQLGFPTPKKGELLSGNAALRGTGGALKWTFCSADTNSDEDMCFESVGFLWGVGSSAYQTEGAWDKNGKGLSIWDAFTHKKGKVFMNETADSSCEGYYKVKIMGTDDIQLLKELKVNHYLLSISWPRIMPTGIKKEQVNEKGIKFYNDTINSLLENKIIPIVTLFHWDLPQ